MNNSSKREKPVNSTKSITIDEESYLKNKSINQESIGISNDNKNYTISSSLLEEGILKFKIDLFFAENILSSIESETKLIFNKVK